MRNESVHERRANVGSTSARRVRPAGIASFCIFTFAFCILTFPPRRCPLCPSVVPGKWLGQFPAGFSPVLAERSLTNPPARSGNRAALTKNGEKSKCKSKNAICDRPRITPMVIVPGALPLVEHPAHVVVVAPMGRGNGQSLTGNRRPLAPRWGARPLLRPSTARLARHSLA